MLTLLTYPRHGDVFSFSPFCVKAALLLTYSGQDWQREDLKDPRRMPHRKLPVLRTPSGLVPDSSEIRRPVTHSIRRSVCTGLAFQGIGRFQESDRKARLEQDLQAVTTLLKDSPFLMGGQITSVDFSVAAMLQAMRSTMVETSLVRRISDDPVLSGYVDRVFHEAVPLS
ncbi:MAG: hypothetical protein COB16_12095 [Rhodobacteraceae bacterium]|nr:MAG: hypothetical protein COB16_12095 [Paracoccaceae bacterium]